MTKQTTYKTEFGSDFKLGVTLNGWTDISYKNDICPCFIKQSKTPIGEPIAYRLWTDLEDPIDRECEESPRYLLETNTGDLNDDMDWNTVIDTESSEIMQEWINQAN